MSGAELFARPRGPVGPVEQAARDLLAGMVGRGELDPGRDGLLIAHVAALAARLDSPTEKAYGAAQVSRELREVYAHLDARRVGAGTAGDPLADLMSDD